MTLYITYRRSAVARCVVCAYTYLPVCKWTYSRRANEQQRQQYMREQIDSDSHCVCVSIFMRMSATISCSIQLMYFGFPFGKNRKRNETNSENFRIWYVTTFYAYGKPKKNKMTEVANSGSIGNQFIRIGIRYTFFGTSGLRVFGSSGLRVFRRPALGAADKTFAICHLPYAQNWMEVTTNWRFNKF